MNDLPRRSLSHVRPTNLETFHWGVAYYPEHWPESAWADHARLMADAGVTLVRLAEFAWDRMEPASGRFEFDWLDSAIASLTKHGIRVMLCTPTAAPPRWMTAADPTMLRVDKDGRVMRHGSRQHVSHCHEGFREHCRRITSALAEHYADRPEVVGWQTDNEFHCHFSEDHSEPARAAFAAWCADRFGGNIEALNAAWGTSFWSQTYTSFEELVTPQDDLPAVANPAHVLDYFRFLSDAVTGFQSDQIRILRRVNPNWWVTHNGLFDHIDYRGRFTEELDFLAYDTYPYFHPDPAKRPAAHAYGLDRARGWSGNFFVPEHQVGAGGQTPAMLDSPRRGEMRHLVYRSIARGADGVLGFRWRSCPSGAEQYWQGVLDHHGQPGARYEEFRLIGAEVARLGPELLGTWVRTDAAVAGADLVVADGFRACSLGLPSPEKVGGDVHRWLYSQGFATGVVHPADDLSAVKLFVIPHWPLFDDEWVPAVDAWVRAGGTLVIGALTGTRDMQNRIVQVRAPGVLSELAGVTVQHFERVNHPEHRPGQLTLVSHGSEETETASDSIPTEHWRESLRPVTPDSTIEVVARWTETEPTSWHQDQTAITRQRLGLGSVVYVGTYLTQPVVSAVMDRCVNWANLTPVLPDLPDSVEVVVRTDGRREFAFLLNTDGSRTATVALSTRWSAVVGDDLICGQGRNQHVELPPLGVAVFQSRVDTA
ncbi:MAG: beta-galactosidase [Planctomycetota bacterium]